MIKAVTIDCWGTLLLDGPGQDDLAYKRQRLGEIQAILAASGIAVALPDLDRAYASAGQAVGRIWRDRRDVPVGHHVTALLDAVEPGLAARLPAATVRAIVDAYARPALRMPPAPDGDAAAVLAELAGDGLALGVVSNTMRTPGEVLRLVLDRAGLLAPFRVLTFSDECGIRKPDPEIFWLTLRQVGARPEEAVHVGDDPVLDVEGARDARMRVIQLSSDRRANGPVKPDAVIAGLGELPAALGRLGRREG